MEDRKKCGDCRHACIADRKDWMVDGEEWIKCPFAIDEIGLLPSLMDACGNFEIKNEE